LTLVSRNLSRRKGRAIISSIGLILAIAVIVSTLTVSAAMQTQIGNEIEKYGPNIIVTPNTQSINVPFGSLVIGNVTISENAVDLIYTIPNNANIRVLSPKIYGQVQYGNDTLLLVGVSPDKEIQLKKWWNLTGSLPRNSTNEIVLGSALRTQLNLPLGSSIQISNTSLIVTGALSETGSVDDYSVFLSLDAAQLLLNQEGKISEIDVGALCNDCPVEKIAQQIMDVVPSVRATPVKQAVETRMIAVQQTANFSLVLATIILVVGVAGIMNTMLASVHERIKEIGIFMSLGADNSHLYKMFFSESILMGLVGGLTGTLLGFVSSMLMGPLLINVQISLAEFPIYAIPLAVGLSILASVVASVYPTWRACRIDPVSAFRAV
jgi:putative ABC transport system permease protein